MTLEADSLAERRRLKRRLRFWRIGAIVLAAIAVLGVLASRSEGFLAQFSLNPHVARVTIEKFIGDNREQRKLLTDLSNNKQVRGVIVFIDSPGGTTAGGEALYNSLRNLAEKKPVVAVFGTMATSAAYLAGIAADHIVTRGNSITGSVGVILQWPEFSELLGKLGIKVEEIRSGPLKAVPSPFTAPDPASHALVEELVNESREWFVDIVTKRRKLVAGAIDQVRTGRIYTGRQAIQIGLVDEIGDEDSALKWLQEQRGVPKGIEVIDRKTDDGYGAFGMHSLAEAAGSQLGGVFGPITRFFSRGGELNHLDGLVSLWHPENSQ